MSDDSEFPPGWRPGMKVCDLRYLKALDARRRFIAYYQENPDDFEGAIVAAGWKTETRPDGRVRRTAYARARKIDPRFAKAVDAIRGTSNGRPQQRKITVATPPLPGGYTREPLVIDPEGEGGKRGWRGFSGFRRRFFGMETFWFQNEIVNVLENSEPGTVTLVLLPPEHGKTSIVEDWLGFKFAIDPNFRVVYTSEKQGHTRKVIKRIKNRMHPDGPCRMYVEQFGPFIPQTGEDAHPQPWSQDTFDVWRRHDSDERDYNMVGLGFGGAVAGTRCDLLVVDDVQSLKSLNATEKIVEEFRQDWLSRPGSHGRTVILGTRVGAGDFYERIMELDLVDHLIKFPAIDGHGRYLWPEHYSEADYARMKKNAGPSAWARNYQQAPMAAGDRTFDEEMLSEAGDKLHRFGKRPEHMDVRSCILGHDPGFGTNAVVVAGVSADKFVLLDWRVDLGLTSTARMAQVIDDTMGHWQGQGVIPRHLVIEDKYVGQGLFNDEAFLELTRKYGCSLSGHKTGRSKNSIDDDLGVAAMARSFRLGEIVLPGADDEETQRARAGLDAELAAWRPNVRGTKLRQDLVMAMWFAWMRWRTERMVTGSDDRSNIIRLQGLGAMRPVGFHPVVSPKGALVFGGQR